MTKTIKNATKAAKTKATEVKDKVTEKKPVRNKATKVEMNLGTISLITDLYSKGYSNEDIVKLIDTFK